jgi:hypothetical protein
MVSRSWWELAESMLVEADVKSEIDRMMATKRFADLVALAKAEGYTRDDSYAAAARSRRWWSTTTQSGRPST